MKKSRWSCQRFLIRLSAIGATLLAAIAVTGCRTRKAALREQQRQDREQYVKDSIRAAEGGRIRVLYGPPMQPDVYGPPAEEYRPRPVVYGPAPVPPLPKDKQEQQEETPSSDDGDE